MSVRSRRAERIRHAMPFAEKLAEYTTEAHEGATLHVDREQFTSIFYALPFEMTRDADALQESNFKVIEKDLTERFGDFIEHHYFGHWAFGGIERLYVRTDAALAIRAAEEWVNVLEGYPIANEEDFTQREWDHNHPSENECYAEDCSCDANERNQHELDAEPFPLHFALALERAETVEYDSDGDWPCLICDGSATFDDAQKSAIAEIAEAIRIRRDNAEREANGQLTIN